MDEDDDIIDPQNFIESVDIELESGDSDDDIDMGVEEHIVENRMFFSSNSVCTKSGCSIFIYN